MELNRPTHEIADPAERDAVTAAKLADMLEHVGAPQVTWPADSGDVIRSMQALGYRADGDYVLGLVNQSVIPVQRVAGKFRWTPFNAWHLLAVLESRRRWTLHPLHAHKLTAMEMTLLQNEAAGKETFDDLDKFDVEQLVLMLEQSDCRPTRHFLRVALMTKLRDAGSL